MDTPATKALSDGRTAVDAVRTELGGISDEMGQWYQAFMQRAMDRLGSRLQGAARSVSVLESQLEDVAGQVAKQEKRLREVTESHTGVVRAHEAAMVEKEAKLKSLGDQVDVALRSLDDLQQQQEAEKSQLRVSVARREAAARRDDEATARAAELEREIEALEAKKATLLTGARR